MFKYLKCQIFNKALYFYKKRILQRKLLMSCGRILKERNNFSHSSASYCNVIISYLSYLHKIIKDKNDIFLTIDADM